MFKARVPRFSQSDDLCPLYSNTRFEKDQTFDITISLLVCTIALLVGRIDPPALKLEGLKFEIKRQLSLWKCGNPRIY